jgi:hypothetical protein
VGQQHHRFLGVVDSLVGQARLVLFEQRDGVLARDVGGGDDVEVFPRDAGVVGDAAQVATGNPAADGDPVEGASDRQIVDVDGLAGDLGDAFLARWACADDRGFAEFVRLLHGATVHRPQVPCQQSPATTGTC